MSDLVYPPVIALAKTWFRGVGLKITVTGAEHVPTSGGAVLVSNHVSYLDFIFCGFGALPSRRLVRFMAKKSVFDHRISGPLMRGMHHIPVDRDAGLASYRQALAALKDGEVVGVFPEATISRSFTLKDTKSGATRMAAAAGVPVIPMAALGLAADVDQGSAAPVVPAAHPNLDCGWTSRCRPTSRATPPWSSCGGE